MANPPSDNNVRFASGFNGTDDATSLATGEFIGATPTFVGGARIEDELNGTLPYWPLVGNDAGTSLKWDDTADGGVELASILGSTLAAGGAFFIEYIFRSSGVGKNHTSLSVGAETGDEKMLEVRFSNGGRLQIRASTNGTSFGDNKIISLSNNARVRYIGIQYLSGRIAVWFAEGMETECEPFTVTKVVDYTPGILHPSDQKLVFGRRNGGSNSSPGWQNWTYVVTNEILYDTWPSSFVFPAGSNCGFPRPTSCAPQQTTAIPDITLFIDEEYSKDYSLFFRARVGSGSNTVFTATGLPDGLSIDSATGVISGAIENTESEGSTHNVTVTVNTTGCGVTEDTFTITVGTVVADGGVSRTTMHSAS